MHVYIVDKNKNARAVILQGPWFMEDNSPPVTLFTWLAFSFPPALYVSSRDKI